MQIFADNLQIMNPIVKELSVAKECLWSVVRRPLQKKGRPAGCGYANDVGYLILVRQWFGGLDIGSRNSVILL